VETGKQVFNFPAHANTPATLPTAIGKWRKGNGDRRRGDVVRQTEGAN